MVQENRTGNRCRLPGHFDGKPSFYADTFVASIRLKPNLILRFPPRFQLSQSMYFSNFVASKLNVWNSNGRHRLEEFLAKMGFSLEQCKQKYPFMSCQLRKRLRDQIEKYAEDYGLQDVFYGELFGLNANL